jgi:predicted RNA binding protein YcfA (HicA-like mRNA interferase family)
VIPVHSGRIIKEPLLRAILRDAQLTLDEFIELL